MHSDAVDPLLDILDFGADLVRFAMERESEREEIERMRYLAVERLFELLGEAVNRAQRADPNVVASIPDAHLVISMRNRIAHEYDDIEHEIIWDAALNDVPALLSRVRQILEANRAL